MIQVSGERSFLGRNPLDVIAQAHALQVEVCDMLERIADGLPDDVDRRLCAQAASYLKYDLPRHHQDEETGLFPLLKVRARPGDDLDDILDRLAGEHMSDTDFAAEIAESLDIMGRGERIPNPDMTGYMLRGFFERYRRHVHWENTLIMPVARRRLTEEDLAVLSATMEGNRAQSL
jgi:hemerythrin-like domain-containing protein